MVSHLEYIPTIQLNGKTFTVGKMKLEVEARSADGDVLTIALK